MDARGLFGTRSVAVATVVGLPVAALSLIVAIYQASSEERAAPRVGATSTVSPSREPAAPTTSSPPAPTVGTTTFKAPPPASPARSLSVPPPEVAAGKATPKVRWAGEIWLSSGGLDVDARPPSRRDQGSDFRKESLTEVTPGSGASLERWLGNGKPAYDDCRAAAEADPALPLFDLPVGGWFCVFTTEDRVAAARSLGLDDTGRSGFGITVWQR